MGRAERIALTLCALAILAFTHTAAYVAGHNAGAEAALLYCGR